MDILSLLSYLLPSNIVDRIRGLWTSNFEIEILICQQEPSPGCSFLYQRVRDADVSPSDGHPDHNALVLVHYKIINRKWKGLAIRDTLVDVFLDNQWVKTLPHVWLCFLGDTGWVSLHQCMPDLQKESVNMQPNEERTFRIAYSFRAKHSLDAIIVRLKIRDSDNQWSQAEKLIPRHPNY